MQSRTTGQMSLAGRALLVSVKTGLHSFEVGVVIAMPANGTLKEAVVEQELAASWWACT